MSNLETHPIETMLNRLNKVKGVTDRIPLTFDSMMEGFGNMKGWSEQVAFLWNLLERPYEPLYALSVSKVFETVKNDIACHPDIITLLKNKRDTFLRNGYLSLC